MRAAPGAPEFADLAGETRRVSGFFGVSVRALSSTTSRISRDYRWTSRGEEVKYEIDGPGLIANFIVAEDSPIEPRVVIGASNQRRVDVLLDTGEFSFFSCISPPFALRDRVLCLLTHGFYGGCLPLGGRNKRLPRFLIRFRLPSSIVEKVFGAPAAPLYRYRVRNDEGSSCLTPHKVRGLWVVCRVS